MVQITTATKKLLDLKKKIRAVSGGTGASKTFSIIMILIDYAQSNDNQKIDIVSESFPHLEDGVIRDFRTIMVDRNYWKDSRWNDTKHIYTFESGSVVKFISFDKLGKAHGPRRDVLFLNECNNLAYNIVDQLITRTRKIVWMDWNPSEEFWFYTEMKDIRKDIDFVRLTYLDNEALSPEEIAEIEAHKHNINWWKVYGLGELGELQGRIYTGWKLDVDEVPHEARLERYCIDFGYTNDPTAIVAIYYFNGGFIFDEIAFLKGLSNKKIADILLNQPKALVVADSAEPKSIDEIAQYGVNILGSDKGKDSVVHGIQLVQEQRISVTKRSVNIIKEYRNYLWATDKNGSNLNEPEHYFSHTMDAVRYGLQTLVRPLRMKQPETNEEAIRRLLKSKVRLKKKLLYRV